MRTKCTLATLSTISILMFVEPKPVLARTLSAANDQKKKRTTTQRLHFSCVITITVENNNFNIFALIKTMWHTISVDSVTPITKTHHLFTLFFWIWYLNDYFSIVGTLKWAQDLSREECNPLGTIVKKNQRRNSLNGWKEDDDVKNKYDFNAVSPVLSSNALI